MSRLSRSARIVMMVFGAAITTPVALAVAADDAQATGYAASYGADDNVICNPGGDDDCP